MTISQADRKLLWARSHNRCAICRRPLTQPADIPGGAGLVLGEEAHIVAKSPSGPRGDSRAGVTIDAYDNLVLLCPEDHKRIDDQPTAFPVERLHELKAAHERWAERQHDEREFSPIRVVAQAGEDTIPFDPLTSGRQIWNLISGAQAWGLLPLDESHTDEEVDAADQFLQNAQDWGNIAFEVELRGLLAVREAQRSLTESLNDLWSAGIYAWGRRLTRTMTGGVGDPIPWVLAQLITRTPGDLEEADSFEPPPAT